MAFSPHFFREPTRLYLSFKAFHGTGSILCINVKMILCYSPLTYPCSIYVQNAGASVALGSIRNFSSDK